MPTYQYRCADCGHQLEVVQSFTDEALTRCPECTGQLRKQFSAVGVVFKGSGFYRTDSVGNGKRSTDSPAKDGESSKEKSTSSASSDSSTSSSSDSSSSSTTASSGSSAATTTAAKS